MKISLFIPCLVDQFYPRVGKSVVRILEKLGHTVIYPRNQTCCGQPAFNTGYWREAAALAVKFINEFNGAEVVVAPSGSCISMVKVFYEKLPLPSLVLDRYRDLQPRIYEFSEFLVRYLKIHDVGAVCNGRVTYHDSCHLLRELGVEEEPRILLNNVSGLELVEMTDSRECCGFGGTFSVKYSHISSKMGEDKVRNITATGARYVVANDSGCLMHIQGVLKRQNSQVSGIHLAEVLDNRCTS